MLLISHPFLTVCPTPHLHTQNTETLLRPNLPPGWKRSSRRLVQIPCSIYLSSTIQLLFPRKSKFPNISSITQLQKHDPSLDHRCSSNNPHPLRNSKNIQGSPPKPTTPLTTPQHTRRHHTASTSSLKTPRLPTPTTSRGGRSGAPTRPIRLGATTSSRRGVARRRQVLLLLLE